MAVIAAAVTSAAEVGVPARVAHGQAAAWAVPSWTAARPLACGALDLDLG
jgi:hypothetical protein